MTQTTINRRRVLAVVAAVPAAVAFSGSAFALGEPGQLAALVRHYFSEVDAFNIRVLRPGSTDEEADTLAAATYEATMRQMIGVPARTADDALAAMDWLIKEGVDFETEYGDDKPYPISTAVTSLVDAIRGYIEGRVS